MPQEQEPFVNLPYVTPTTPADADSVLASQIGGHGNFSDLIVGAGAKAFKADQSGWWQGADKFADAPAKCDMDGNAVFNSITINGRSGATIAASIDADGNFVNELISDNFNTQTKQILGSFTFGVSGAIAIATDASNGLWLSPTGLLGKKAGATTFAIDTGGNATFGGSLVAASGTLGSITAGTFTGCVFQTAASGARFVLNADMMYFYNGSYPFVVWFADVAGSGYAGDFRLGDYPSGKFMFWDNSAGTLTIRGSLNANDITAGTITGRTLRTAEPAAGVGSAVVITGGSNEMIHLYYDATETGWIKGYTTEGSEVTYIEIGAASGRKIRFKNSFIECGGNFNPTVDEGYNLGTSGTKWNEVYANRIYQQNSPGSGAYVYDFGYVEMGLLSDRLIKKHQGGINGKGLMPIDKTPIFSLPFKLGTVLKWTGNGLRKSIKNSDFAVAVANEKGFPIILGAEKVRVIGEVKIGDYIVPSNIPGCAMASENPIGSVIGRSLENKKNKKESLIKVLINLK